MIFDLAALDRLVGRAAIALLDGPSDVLEGAYREVARQSTFKELAAIAPPLALHVAHFVVLRVSGSAPEAAMAEMVVPAPALPRAVTSGPRVSFDGALLETVAASSLEAARAWLAVAAGAATKPADAARARAEIADEAARRLGIEPDRALASEADAFLDRTAELAASIAGEPAAILSTASARSAGEGWPRKPSLQAAIELLGSDATARRTIERIAERARSRKKPPVVLGASSWLRAIAGWAFDWHARMPGDGPFAERHDPEWTDAHGSALLVASALATTQFQRRSLGCSERVAKAQTRALAISGLVLARMDAARLLSPDAERSERLFGRTISAKLGAIVPRPRRDARGRFRAWLDLPSLLDRARSLHDEDWFRNPRFWEEAAIRFALPRAPKSEPPPATALAKAFVERLA